MATKLVVTKVGAEPPVIAPEIPKVAGKKTLKTYPRGVLKTSKIRPVADPAKSPPLRKTMKRHTIRLVTEKGVQHRRRTIKKRVSRMSNEKVKKLVINSGLLKNTNTPVPLMREMLEGGMVAGFISV
jgi:hypothetical protein